MVADEYSPRAEVIKQLAIARAALARVVQALDIAQSYVDMTTPGLHDQAPGT